MAAPVNLTPGKTRIRVYQWTLTNDDPDGDPIVLGVRYPDKAIHAFGTWGGATVALKGSNEIVAAPTDWQSLHDPSVSGLASFTASGIKQVLENPYQMAPFMSGGMNSSVVVLLALSVTP